MKGGQKDYGSIDYCRRLESNVVVLRPSSPLRMSGSNAGGNFPSR